MNLANAEHNKLFSRELKKYGVGNIGAENLNSSLELIARQIDEKSRILDVGCSAGYLGEWLIRNKACEVYGIDNDQEMVGALKSKNQYKDVFCIDLDEMKRREEEYKKIFDLGNTFDYVICADVIEHLKWPTEFLLNINRTLKMGGYLLVSIPNIANIDIVLHLLGGKFNYSNLGLLDNTHLRFFTQSSFLEWVDSINQMAEIDYSLKCDKIQEIKYISDFSNTMQRKYPEVIDCFFQKSDELSNFQYIMRFQKVARNDPVQQTHDLFPGGERIAEKQDGQSLERVVNNLDRVMRDLKTEVDSKEQQISKLEETLALNKHLLDNIYKSDAWKIVGRYFRFRDGLFPLGSRRRKWVKVLWERIRHPAGPKKTR